MARPLVSGPTPVIMSVLRVKGSDQALTPALSTAFEVAWPTTPNTSAKALEGPVLWLAPTEWAIVGTPSDVVRRRAASALGEALHHVADIGNRRVAFTLEGPWSREVIAKGCSLDLHPRRFPPGALAQTLMAQCAVLIHRPADSDRFDIILDATLSGHMQAWLADAAVEFSL